MKKKFLVMFIMVLVSLMTSALAVEVPCKDGNGNVHTYTSNYEAILDAGAYFTNSPNSLGEAMEMAFGKMMDDLTDTVSRIESFVENRASNYCGQFSTVVTDDQGNTKTLSCDSPTATQGASFIFTHGVDASLNYHQDPPMHASISLNQYVEVKPGTSNDADILVIENPRGSGVFNAMSIIPSSVGGNSFPKVTLVAKDVECVANV